jgi:hypothetical protein
MPKLPILNGKPDAEAAFREAVSKAFRELLSEKHLYQYVDVDFSYLDKIAEWEFGAAEIRTGRLHHSSLQDYRNRLVNPWEFLWSPDNTDVNHILIQQLAALAKLPPSEKFFPLPGIQTLCPHCDSRWPFNAKAWSVDSSSLVRSQQFFHLSYECQMCKKEPLHFLIARKGKRLTLAGRSAIESVAVPKSIPKDQATFYSGAIIAHQCGQTLAGLFMLRVFIEQYWLSISFIKSKIKKGDQPSGQFLGEAYNNQLDSDVKERFPSLPTLYTKLSEALHSANSDPVLFDSALHDVNSHFNALKLFETAIRRK